MAWLIVIALAVAAAVSTPTKAEPPTPTVEQKISQAYSQGYERGKNEEWQKCYSEKKSIEIRHQEELSEARTSSFWYGFSLGATIIFSSVLFIFPLLRRFGLISWKGISGIRKDGFSTDWKNRPPPPSVVTEN